MAELPLAWFAAKGEHMATGANEQYWDGHNLPSTFKHELLKKYVPRFTGMTGLHSAEHRVIFLDGYAGRGRYRDGSPGSAEMIMKMAGHQESTNGLTWTCFFVERDSESSRMLADVVAEYAGLGLDVRSHHGDVLSILRDVLAVAEGRPLFLFLDPTGYGLSFRRLVDVLTRTGQAAWPPTEALLNFSLEAVRRTGGHVASPQGNEATMRRLDDAVGGTWWRDLFRSESGDAAVEHVVEEFKRRLGSASGMHVTSAPVCRAPHHKSLYHLVFCTRKQHGLWFFGDSVSRATQKWWDTLEGVEESSDQFALFSGTRIIRPTLEAVETEAVPVIAENLARLLVTHRSYVTIDHTLPIFGEFYGQVREKTVRDAVKLLYKDGRTGCNGVGTEVRKLLVTRP